MQCLCEAWASLSRRTRHCGPDTSCDIFPPMRLGLTNLTSNQTATNRHRPQVKGMSISRRQDQCLRVHRGFPSVMTTFDSATRQASVSAAEGTNTTMSTSAKVQMQLILPCSLGCVRTAHAWGTGGRVKRSTRRVCLRISFSAALGPSRET